MLVLKPYKLKYWKKFMLLPITKQKPNFKNNFRESQIKNQNFPNKLLVSPNLSDCKTSLSKLCYFPVEHRISGKKTENSFCKCQIDN